MEFDPPMRDVKPIKLEQEWSMFGGRVKQFSHPSDTLSCTMKFKVFVPPQAAMEKVPVLYYLSGLTCTDENCTQKAGAQRAAAKEGN